MEFVRIIKEPMNGVNPNPPKSKLPILVAVIVIIIVAVLAVWYLAFREGKTPEEKAAESVEKTLEAASAGTLPEINPLSNPLEKLPDVNPVDTVNPFKDIKTNPFE